ncbi:MAG TPA: hypothetical protein VH590_15035, partial [Ktedonobacterales bacterium]
MPRWAEMARWERFAAELEAKKRDDPEKAREQSAAMVELQAVAQETWGQSSPGVHPLRLEAHTLQ